MASVKLDLVNQLRALHTKLKTQEQLVENGMDKLEEGKKIRDEKRKELLLREVKNALANLHETDKKLVRDLKSEVFDHIRSVSKVEKELSKLIDLVKISDNKDMDMMQDAVLEVTKQVNSLGLQDISSGLGLRVAVQQNSLSAFFHKLPDLIYLNCPGLDASDWMVEVQKFEEMFNSKYLEIKIMSRGEECRITDLLLKKCLIRVVSNSGDILEESTLQNKVTRGLAEVRRNPSFVQVRIKRPMESKNILSVTILSTNIGGSPLLLPHSEQDIAIVNQTMGPNSSCVNVDMGDLELTRYAQRVAKDNFTDVPNNLKNGDLRHYAETSLDQSDYNSLDMTKRRQLQLASSSSAYKQLGGHYDSLSANPFPRVSQKPNLSELPEKLGETDAAASMQESVGDLTSFSPRSQGTTSTVSGRSQLQHMLTEALDSCPGLPGRWPEEATTKETSFRDDEMLGPRSNLALEEVQSGLSSSGSQDESGQVSKENSPIVNKSMAAANKSVNFADKTEICQLLGTPQVKGGSNKFVMMGGQTKTTDGAGEKVQSQHANIGQSLHNKDSDLTLPFHPIVDGAETVDNFKASATDQRKPLQYSVSILRELLPSLTVDSVPDPDEDPHLMLNASKAPSPNQSWPASPTPSEWEMDEVEAVHNVSILPSEMLLDYTQMDQSCWEVESQKPDNCFNFFSSLQQCGKLEYQANPSKTSCDNYPPPCLAAPCDVTLLPKRRLLLVTEPPFNRIGIYDADDLTFKDWCLYPYGKKGSTFFYPTSILCTKEDFVLVLEKHQLLILDTQLQPHQPPIKGKFAGLVEDDQGDIYTLHQGGSFRTSVKKLKIDKRPRKVEMYGKELFWWEGPEIPLTVAERFSGWDSLSRCWFLTYRASKLYVSDVGLSKVYTLDLNTGSQTAFGYLGSNDGQLSGPAGILTDDKGNLLVSDSGNNRLVVYNEAGHFIRVADTPQGYSTPYGLARHENTVVALYQGRVTKTLAAIIRYRISEKDGDEDANGKEASQETAFEKVLDCGIEQGFVQGKEDLLSVKSGPVVLSDISEE